MHKKKWARDVQIYKYFKISFHKMVVLSEIFTKNSNIRELQRFIL